MNERRSPLGRVVAKALQDEAFKQRLIADPTAILGSEGVEIPPGMTIRVVADTGSVRHLVLPADGEGALSDDVLDGVAAGGTGFCGQDWPPWRF